MRKAPKIAIVDFGLGNLFSVARACLVAEGDPFITSSAEAIRGAPAIILPGVGAFGDAMDTLKRLNLDTAIIDFFKTGKPILGVCLGMQLLFEQSSEFGQHQGLGLLGGKIERFPDQTDESGRALKVPQIGWNRLRKNHETAREWSVSALSGLKDDDYMYFVHSFCATEVPKRNVLAFKIGRAHV